MIQVGIHVAKTRLSELLKRVLLGERIIIANAGRPIAELTPFRGDQKKRKSGSFRGQLKWSKNFDDSSKEIEALFYGGKNSE